MFDFEVNDSVILQQQKVLEQALSTNPKTQKSLQKLIRKVIMEARANVIANIKFENGDPHHSARAVRTAVYKKILGANINIYNSRRTHSATTYEPARNPSRRGGNRMARSQRTSKIMNYKPELRGFILRFVNSGTKGRYAGFGRNGRNDAEYERFVMRVNGRGWRGQITPRDFFRPAGEQALVRAADELANLIDTELENILNKRK